MAVTATLSQSTRTRDAVTVHCRLLLVGLLDGLASHENIVLHHNSILLDPETHQVQFMIEPMPFALLGVADNVAGREKNGVSGGKLGRCLADTDLSKDAEILACLDGDSTDFGQVQQLDNHAAS